MKKRKRSVLFTIVINLLFIAGIALVGWKIYDYVNDSRQTTKLAEELWEQAAITAAPVTGETIAESSATAKPATEEDATETEVVAASEAGVSILSPATEAMPETEEGRAKAAVTAGQETTEKTSAAGSGTDDPAATSAPAGKPADDTDKTKAEQANAENFKPEETPAPDGREKNNGKVNTAFLNMLNTTPTPEPTPRFTDMPDIPVAIDFDRLAKINKAVSGWLYHPGMGINQPVVHAPDNEYYLKRGFDRYGRQAGTLFIDYRNKGDFSDRNTIIYGHARRDLSMFGKLHYYKKAEYCEKHPFFYLYVPGHRYRLEIIATGYTTDASDYYDLPAGDYWDELLDKLIERNPYDFGISISPDDHYVTLSTCAYDYQNERWLVIARIDDPEGSLPPLPEK